MFGRVMSKSLVAGLVCLALRDASAFGQPSQPVSSAESQTLAAEGCIVHQGQTQNQLMQTYRDLKAAGYRPTSIYGYVSNGRARYDSTWEVKDGIPSRFGVNMTTARYEQLDDEMAARGYKRVCHSRYHVNGEVRHSALWERDS
jgi:hypothetical protein